jgi:hypothetical protein
MGSVTVKWYTFHVYMLCKVFWFNLAPFSLIVGNPNQLILETYTHYIHLEQYTPKNRTRCKKVQIFLSSSVQIENELQIPQLVEVKCTDDLIVKVCC